MVYVIVEIVSLLLSYLLMRFPLFFLHGSYDGPLLALLPAIIGIAYTFIKNRKSVTVAVSCGYIAGFALAKITEVYGVDQGGGRTSSVFTSWVTIYAFIIILAIGWEAYRDRNGNTHLAEVLKTAKEERKGAEELINVLFLDYDGVLNLIKPDHEYVGFDKECMNNVSRLCLEFNLKIVVSSSWRNDPFMNENLYEMGLDRNVEIIGRTENIPGPREQEIISYLQKNVNIARFIVLDDIPFDELKPYQVRTTYCDGFNEEKYQQARKLLINQKENR